MKKELLDEFIAFVQEQHGVVLKVKTDSTPDTFEKIFGCSFEDADQESIDRFSLEDLPIVTGLLNVTDTEYQQNYSFAA